MLCEVDRIVLAGVL